MFTIELTFFIASDTMLDIAPESAPSPTLMLSYKSLSVSYVLMSELLAFLGSDNIDLARLSILAFIANLMILGLNVTSFTPAILTDNDAYL